MADDSPRIAAALPAYEIGRELGRGAFGRVFEARHRRLDRLVAVKQLSPGFASDPDVRARFLAEAQLLASLDHPHVVPVHDFVEHDGQCLLVMEKLSGGTVWQTYQREGISMESACALMLATCAGLHCAHQNGVLHRDVKPDNLMFSGAGTLKVTDFGIAKVVEGAKTMTQAGTILGTPAYMAPEQAQGAALSPATDVYAAGTVLFELLSGRLPFDDEGTAIAVLYRHVNDEPDELTTVAPEVPDGIAAVVMRAIARAPADRYRSAEAFGLALAAAATEAWGRRWLYPTGRILLAEGPILAMLQDAAADLPPEPGVAATLPPRTVTKPAGAARPSAPRGQPPVPEPRLGRGRAIAIGVAGVVAVAVAATVLLLRAGKSDHPSPPPAASGGAAAGAASVRIDRITRQGDAYLVFYSAQNFVPRLEAGNRHIHFFWNTVEPENAGANGRPPKPYAVYAGPVPFRGFKVADRPAGASQICALVADETNSVEVGTGNCAAVP